jgi:signal transduction histidine kinase
LVSTARHWWKQPVKPSCGLILAALALTGTGLAFVSHYRSVERQQATAKLSDLQLAKQRSERLAAAGALTAGLAHEVRSPLNAIGLAAQRLGRALPDSEGGSREMARGIGREVRRLEGVLRSFLELASPVGGDRESVDLRRLATEVVTLLEAEADANQVRLEPVRGSAVARVDREALRRALINLVRNAIQASPPESRVDISVTSTSDLAEISVTDQGPGLDPEIAGRIFDPFVTGRDAGTGLGLALVKRVVEEHGGTVSLEGLNPRGTLARIALPAMLDPLV